MQNSKPTPLSTWSKAVPWVFVVFLLLVSIWAFQLNTVGVSPGATADAQAENDKKTPDATATAQADQAGKSEAKPQVGAKTQTEAQTLTLTESSAGSESPAVQTAAAANTGEFLLVDAQDIPDNGMGEMIRKGEQIFLHTGANAPEFVGNTLNCVNCHLDAGRLADSAPMWAAYGLYPAYREKTGSVSTFAERLRGCFMYSMNGKAPPDGDDVLVALESYAYWMAQGAPAGEKLPGAGYPALEAPEQELSLDRGREIYAKNCAVCHGDDGQGQRVDDVQVFPALWGDQSFNWGAGMARVNTAAGFIKANMPYGHGHSLSDQEAWDVAYYMDTHERPQDPRFDGDLESTRQKFHDSKYEFYGREVNGKLLGDHNNVGDRPS